MGAERPGCAYPRSARLGLGGVARRRWGWAGAPGGRCRRHRHSAAMERPRGAADCLSCWPHGLGLGLLLFQLLWPATLGQDRLDSPPPPAAPLSRWSGPVGVRWGLRAAAPGGPFLPGGRWRRSAPAEDEDCGRVRDFVSRLANNTHQVSGRRAGRRRDCEVPPRAAPAAGPTFSVRAPRVSAEEIDRSPAPQRPQLPGRGLETVAGGVRPGERPPDAAARAAVSSLGRQSSEFHGIPFFFFKLSKWLEHRC